jgi:hypothetical protein
MKWMKEIIISKIQVFISFKGYAFLDTFFCLNFAAILYELHEQKTNEEV